ncbi:MAG: NADP-dependent oxidoreductase [Pyrinomonadaceae bacterium]
MKVIQIHEYGDAYVLRYEDADKPAVLLNDVLIRVIATSFNLIDAKIRQGFMQEMLPKPFPIILGWDCAGIVAEIGENVTKFKVGDEVFGYPEFARGGTYAEFVAVDESQIALKPKTLSFVESASLPIVAQTALTAIETAQLQANQRILIHGGAGGVGSNAIQIAKELGAYIITTASGEGIELVKSLGADEVIDYKTTNFKDVAKDVDVVLDVLGGQTQDDSWQVMKKGGILIATAFPPNQEKAEQFGVRAEFIFTQPRGEALEKIAQMVDANKLRPNVGTELTLADAQKAHEAKGGNGKIIINVGAV